MIKFKYCKLCKGPLFPKMEMGKDNKLIPHPYKQQCCECYADYTSDKNNVFIDYVFTNNVGIYIIEYNYHKLNDICISIETRLACNDYIKSHPLIIRHLDKFILTPDNIEKRISTILNFS
jgi:hypothetical protein